MELQLLNNFLKSALPTSGNPHLSVTAFDILKICLSPAKVSLIHPVWVKLTKFNDRSPSNVRPFIDTIGLLPIEIIVSKEKLLSFSLYSAELTSNPEVPQKCCA